MWPIGSITHLMGTWLVTLVTIQRYVSVCFPLMAGKWTSIKSVKWQTFWIVVASILFYTPRMGEYGVIFDNVQGKYVRKKSNWAKGEIYNLTYKVILYYIFIYVIPLSVLIFCTYKLIISLRKVKKKKTEIASKNADKGSDFTLSLIIVVIVFIICQIFNPIRRFLYDYFLEIYQRDCPYFYWYFQLFSGNILMLNSAVNFGIYFLSARGFKKKFLLTFGCPLNKVAPKSSNKLETDG